MKYIEIKLTITPSDPWKDIFTSIMGDAGCDSFMDGEKDGELLCYIPEKDYDEGSIREIVENHGFEELGRANTLCGGGRYDNLVSTLGGPETPGVGFALGMERLLTANFNVLIQPMYLLPTGSCSECGVKLLLGMFY